ncbi:MAG: KpsF/GutQ family sugar-phosphate isomerase, partial [Gemmatimonadaceae bacterium]
VRMLAGCQGRVIVSGVGKSGLIGHKIAATLTSTGTPATFLHPSESAHGDLGIVGSSDVGILISRSGESEELVALVDQLKRFGVPTIAITGAKGSALARHADVALDATVEKEACPHDLAPTTSTTVALALGEALAIALLEEKGFAPADFARLHPGGSLGRRLLTRVSDVMMKSPLPLVPSTATLRQVVVLIADQRGLAIISDDQKRINGVYTAGDLTRLMEHEENVFPIVIGTVMNTKPKTAHADELGSAVVFRMEQDGIMAMPVLDANENIVGVVHLHDLMRAGVV